MLAEERAHDAQDAMQEFLAQHALFAGFLSLLQVGLLPGLLLALRRPQVGGWLLLPLGIAISLVVNFQLTFLLTLLGLYRVEALALLVAVAASVLHGRKPPQDTAATSGGPDAPIRNAIGQPLVLAGSGAAGAALLMLCSLLWTHVPGVFDSWDAVVSWNRWAVDWFGGRLPSFTYGYPQLVPAAWAGTYVWLGTARVEFFAKGLMLAFPLGVAAILVDMYARFRQPAALFAVAFWCWALLRAFPDLVDSGYVDVPVAFFISLTAYLLFLGRRQAFAPSVAFRLAAVSAAGAVLTKQAGAMALAMLAWGLWARRGDPTLRGEWRRDAMPAVIAFLVLTLPWFGYTYYQIAAGIDTSNVGYVTSDMYAGESLPARLWRAVTVNTAQGIHSLGPTPWVAVAMLTLAVGALRSPLGRACWLGVVLPYYLIWALFFSYDLRNLVPAIPFACLGLGAGLQNLWPVGAAPPSTPETGPARRSSRGAWRAVAALVLLGALAAAALSSNASRERMIALNDLKRMESGDPALNRRLLDFARTPGFAGKILTTYAPVASIDGLREHFYATPESPSPSKALLMALKEQQPLCRILSMMPRHEELRYLLLHTGVYPAVIDAAVGNGSLRTIFQTSKVRFFEIACRF